ncbi:MAG TPA: phosphoribulokinase [Acidimicrobiales bacterium]|nr:phosphoribulokinase [Acidimicrobiales bacterium]
MSPKRVVIRQASRDGAHRPIMLAVAGDSAAGKTTLTRGLVAAMGGEGITSFCVDDYHRYDRQERKGMPFTPLNPACNYVGIMEQHLQLVAMGEPILKPVYNHRDGTLERPVLFEPGAYVIVEGLLPLYNRLSRACFDLTVYLDPPEEIRRAWKVKRDTRERGYKAEQVLEDLERREPEAAAFIRPQRQWADIVVRFAPIEGRTVADGALSATILLRPTAPHPDLSAILTEDTREAIHLKLARDIDGKPVDALHVHAYASRELTRQVEEAIWNSLGLNDEVPESLGVIEPGERSEPLAVVQLLLLYHLRLAQRMQGSDLDVHAPTSHVSGRSYPEEHTHSKGHEHADGHSHGEETLPAATSVARP